MRVLLDNNVTHRLGPFIVGHEVIHAREKGWADLQNGDLIASAEQDGFDVLITADKGMMYQQNLSGRRISILLLRNYRITLSHLRPLVPEILKELDHLDEGAFVVVTSADYA